jgi:hypothetical protein
MRKFYTAEIPVAIGTTRRFIVVAKKRMQKGNTLALHRSLVVGFTQKPQLEILVFSLQV